MAQQDTENSKTPDRLRDRLNPPENRLTRILPFIGLASILALIAVTVLGVIMLDTLSRKSNSRLKAPGVSAIELQEMDERVERLERSQKDLQTKLDFISAIVNKLYASRPLTEVEKELAKLYTLPPDELLRRGLHAERTGAERPTRYYEVLLDSYPDCQQASAAMLHLGALRTRLGDYEEAVKPLRTYLERYETLSAYDTARVHYYLALAVTSLQNKKEAAEHFKKALAGFPKQDILRADAHFNLAETYRQLGDKTSAAAEYQAVLDEFTGDKRATDMIELTEYRLESLKEGRD